MNMTDNDSFVKPMPAWRRTAGNDRGRILAQAGARYRRTFALFLTRLAPRYRSRSRLGKGTQMRLLLCCLSVMVFSVSPAWADWTLKNDQSQLSFISIKKGDIAEVHRFDRLEGSVDKKGNVKLVIELASVDTAIPIRDERMREMLFDTKVFPRATLSGTVDANQVSKLKVGDMMVNTIQGQLSMHGKSSPVNAELVVARLAADTLLIASRKPVVLQAGDFDLLAGVEKLREVAGLSSISNAVPVNFVLTFSQN